MPARFARVQPWLSTVARLVLGVTLAIAGWQKVTDLDASVRAVRAFQILPEAVVGTFGYALPMVELMLGGLLVIGLTTRFAALVGGLLMLAFSIGIASVWVRGISIDCGCFGGGGPVAKGQEGYALDLARDIGLALLGAFLVIWPHSRFSADGALGLTSARPLEAAPAAARD